MIYKEMCNCHMTMQNNDISSNQKICSLDSNLFNFEIEHASDSHADNNRLSENVFQNLNWNLEDPRKN